MALAAEYHWQIFEELRSSFISIRKTIRRDAPPKHAICASNGARSKRAPKSLVSALILPRAIALLFLSIGSPSPAFRPWPPNGRGLRCLGRQKHVRQKV